jgi:hypothetical protein
MQARGLRAIGIGRARNTQIEVNAMQTTADDGHGYMLMPKALHEY